MTGRSFLGGLVAMPGRIWTAALRAAPFRQWAQAGAAFAFSQMLLWTLYVVWRGGWSPESETQRLDILGRATLLLTGLILLCLLAITDLAMSFRASRSGLEANVGADDHAGPDPLGPPAPPPQ